jgi:hypothetical protein
MGIYLFCLCLGFAGLVTIAILGHSHGLIRHVHSHHAHAHSTHASAHGSHARSALISITHDWISPRVFFSLIFAFGATGLLLDNLLPGALILIIALAAAWAFERWLVQPLWRLLFGFASNPARTLESCLLEEAEAVTNFDRRGQGLVAVNLDGQLVQILASLSPDDQKFGVRVRAGERLSITAVNAKRNSCTVTRLPLAARRATEPAAS